MNVAIVGKGRNCPMAVSEVARAVGTAVAEAGHITITGGLGGVMLSAALGAALAGGEVIGFVPLDGEPDVSFPGLVIRTGLPVTIRNVVIASCCDAMLVLEGSHGTMQELALALDRGIPIATVGTDMWLGLEQLRADEVEAWLQSVS